jgi:hypothetical protein
LSTIGSCFAFKLIVGSNICHKLKPYHHFLPSIITRVVLVSIPNNNPCLVKRSDHIRPNRTYRRGLSIPTQMIAFPPIVATCRAHIRRTPMYPMWNIHSSTCKDEIESPLCYLTRERGLRHKTHSKFTSYFPTNKIIFHVKKAMKRSMQN